MSNWKKVPLEPTDDIVEAAFVGMVEDQSLPHQIARRQAMREAYIKMVAKASYPEATTDPEEIALIQRARYEYADDEINIDDNAAFSHADDGSWVQAWVWIAKPEGDGE